MAKIPYNFTMFESPFKVLEDFDLNYDQTPTSSTRVQKKLLYNNISSDKRENNVTFWHNKFIINKHPLQLTTFELKTPPMNKSPSTEPLAPIKLKKSINKTELKPKKLIFKDIEESEMESIEYPMKFTIKYDDIANKTVNKLKINRKKYTLNDEKENQRELFTQTKNNQTMNDNNNLFMAGVSNNNNNNTCINALSTDRSKYSHNKSDFKHFRI